MEQILSVSGCSFVRLLYSSRGFFSSLLVGASLSVSKQRSKRSLRWIVMRDGGWKRCASWLASIGYSDRYPNFTRVRLLLPLLLVLLVSGCCTRSVTGVHNSTGRDVDLTVVREGEHDKTLALRSDASVLIDEFAGSRPTAFVVTDGGFRYTFADISAAQQLPSHYVSSSRFTSDFPCRRITRWIAIVPKDELWAARFGDPTDAQPKPFPLYPSKKESVR